MAATLPSSIFRSTWVYMVCWVEHLWWWLPLFLLHPRKGLWFAKHLVLIWALYFFLVAVMPLKKFLHCSVTSRLCNYEFPCKNPYSVSCSFLNLLGQKVTRVQQSPSYITCCSKLQYAPWRARKRGLHISHKYWWVISSNSIRLCSVKPLLERFGGDWGGFWLIVDLILPNPLKSPCNRASLKRVRRFGGFDAMHERGWPLSNPASDAFTCLVVWWCILPSRLEIFLPSELTIYTSSHC